MLKNLTVRVTEIETRELDKIRAHLREKTYNKTIEDELEAFIDYRTEPNKKGEQRYELEKTFCPNRRFRTWLRNNKKWARDTPKKSTTITTF